MCRNHFNLLILNSNGILSSLGVMNFVIHMMIYEMVNGEYLIKNGEIPSYLTCDFIELNDDIFPKDIRINISISRVEGTLLYTIDKHRNQLIISLHEEIEEKLKLEFRGEEHYFLLSELCGCQRCKYIPLMLHLQIDELLKLQCNDRAAQMVAYKEIKSINNAYPIIDKTDKHIAALWLINTPTKENIYSNNEQLFGCLFEVFYNNKPLKLVTFGSGIREKCHTKCTKNVCNGGNCHELFDGGPVCDCTYSYLNGKYCNSSGISLTNHKIQSVPKTFRFFQLKISWKSNSSEIVNILNKNTKIRVFVSNDNLMLIVSFMHDVIYTIQGTITEKYNAFYRSRLFITFGSEILDFQYLSETGSSNLTLPVKTDLSTVYFTSMTLSNGVGEMDVAYKSYFQEYGWTRMSLISPGIKNKTIYSTDDNFSFKLMDLEVNEIKTNDKKEKTNANNVTVGDSSSQFHTKSKFQSRMDLKMIVVINLAVLFGINLIILISILISWKRSKANLNVLNLYLSYPTILSWYF